MRFFGCSMNPRIGISIVSLRSLKRLSIIAAAMAFLFLPCNGRAADLLNDSIEDLSIRFINLAENPINPPFCSGTTIYVQVLATLESGATPTYKEFSAHDDGGLLSWTSAKGQIISTIGNFPGDSYVLPVTATSTTDTITVHLTTEWKSFFSDDETAKKVVPVVNCNNPNAAVPAPNPPVFASAGNGYDFLVPVTLTNPFSQALIVDAESLSTPSVNGTIGSNVFDPFGQALDDGRFYLSPNSSVTAAIGISFPSSLDQDLNLRVSGSLADGTLVSTPLMMLETVDSSSSLSGTFQTVPEPSTLFMCSMVGPAALASRGSGRATGFQLGPANGQFSSHWLQYRIDGRWPSTTALRATASRK